MSARPSPQSALSSAPDPPRSGYTRVAVVQLAYLPAALRRDRTRSPLEDPLFDLRKPEQADALLPQGMTSPPEALRKELRGLRRRIREAYNDQLLRRAQAVLEACRALHVGIVVFPEYSLPFELLEPLAQAAPEMVVVVGTHAVESAAVRSQVYERLGAARAPRLRESVCPVLHSSKLLGLQPKLSPAAPEQDIMEPGETWAPIALPGDLPGPMGVLICLDFLHRESKRHLALVTPHLDECCFLAVPSLTPYASLPEFEARIEVDARRYKRPVLYCNHADFGGSRILVDEKEHPFPEGAGRLGQGDEAVLVADVRLERVPAGRSTAYAEPRLLTSVAAPTLVYGAQPGESAYAAWLKALSAATDAGAGEIAALQAFAAEVHGAEAILREAGRSGIRAQRLSRLLDEIDDANSLERLRQLTREILLPSDVLPLPALRAALALGAADVLSAWPDRFGPDAHPFGPIEQRLRREGGVAIWSGTDTLTLGARRAFEEIAQRVRGGAAAPRSREILVSVVEAYREVARGGLDARQKDAQRAFSEGSFEEARSLFRGMLVGAEEILAREPEDGEMRRWASRCRLNVAACSLNLQQIEEAAADLRQIDVTLLSIQGRCTLAECLAYTGDLDAAKAALPAEEPGLADEDRERLAEIRQILSLREGELPAELGPGSAVQRQAAELLLERDDLDGAAQHALRAIDGAEAQASLTKASALSILIASLQRSVLEEPPSARFIALEHREEVVQRIDRELEAMRFEGLPRGIRLELRRWQAAYYGLVGEAELRQAMLAEEEGAPEEPVSTPTPSAEARVLADRLAKEGRLEEALAALPAVEHPWHGRWQRVVLTSLAQRADRALAEVLELARDAPGKAPVEHLAATLLQREGRNEEALPHAQATFTALPGRGQRLLLAQCLLSIGRGGEAWGVLQPLHRDRRTEVLVLLAQTAEISAPREAPTLWEVYLKARPDDAQAKVRRAQALYKIGERTEAAEAAWEALQQHKDVLDAHAISLSANLQRLRGEPDELTRERVQEAAALLRRRFPGDPQAEFFRFQLLVPLEGTLEAEPIDYTLLTQGGLLEALPAEQGIERIRQGRDLDEAVVRFYRMGGLPFASLCEATGSIAPRKLATLVHRARAEPGAFCAPVAFEAAWPAISLEGAELLVSDLELYLLQHLDLLPRLKESLGHSGKLVLLQETRQRILEDSASLKDAAPRERLKRYEHLAALAARLPKLPRAAEGAVASRESPAEAMWLVREEEAPPGIRRLSPRTLAQRLFEEGRISDEQLGALLGDRPQGPASPWPEPPPERLGITGLMLEQLSAIDALPALLEAFPGRLLVDPQTEAWIHGERARLAFEVEVADLAERVDALVARGLGTWIRLETALELPTLPPFKEESASSEEMRERLVLAPLRWALALRSLMHREKSLRRLTADFFGSSVLGHPDQIGLFAWPSHEHFFLLSQWNREAAARDLHLPALVRLLLPSPRGDEKLLRLAELGFPDALGAGELLRLERRYGGLAKAEPRRLLDRMEWMAREPGHLGGEMARLRLAGIYAEAIWLAFCGGGRGGGEEQPSVVAAAGAPRRDDAEAGALAAELLRRVEVIDAEVGAALLDQLLLFVMLKACERPLAFIQREGEAAVLDEQSRGGRLWQFLYEIWAPVSPGRRAALGRAVQAALCVLDRVSPEGPALPQVMPLVLVMEVGQRSGRGSLRISLEQPEIEAAAILSAHWRNKPLATVGLDISTPDESASQRLEIEEALAYGAVLLGDAKKIRGDERRWLYPFPLQGLQHPIEVLAPLEALLLRAEPRTLAEVARHWARWQGPHDGRAYRLLVQIAGKPEDLALRREYARFTAMAPWRLVREDPAFLLRWPARRGADVTLQAPRLADLRAMLSEPEGPLPAEHPGDLLVRRLDSGALWADRPDQRALFFQACEVPGSLPAATLGSKLAEEVYAQEVEAALDRLDHPDEHPVARLAGDLYFLRVAAANKPRVGLRVGELDFSKELPDRVLRLLNHVAAPPQAGTLAEVEGALLRACRQVVRRLSRAEPLSLRDDLWLTYRLFQWLCAQLQAIDPEARRAGLSRLAQGAPPSEEGVQDLLDPAHFDRGLFDHRLATVLYALAAMEELIHVAAVQEQEPQEPPHAISSAALEVKLAELAARPRRGLALRSVLEWSAPAESPDLALIALLRRNPEAFLVLAPETRLQWLETLPEAPDVAEEGQRELIRSLVTAASDNAAGLGPAERAAFEAKLRAMDESPTARKLRWIGLSSLFGPAAPHLEAEARALLLSHLEDSLAPLVCGRFLSAIGALDPGRLEAEAEVLLARASEHSEAGAGVILVGVARVALAGPAEARVPARELLGNLARRAPFNEDPKVREILRFMQIPEPSS